VSLEDKIIALAKYFKIAHQISGRVRFKVSSSIVKNSIGLALSDIDEIQKKLNGIKSIRVNKMALSVTISYHTSIINDNFWIELIQSSDKEYLSQRLTKLIK